ncbi:MAG: AbrB/MazE/SpoVT family DNA-binding domain-containing protein [Betaproteobacteria bacterium]|nr:AbrB/MazE/SpoVT family DNA-binding domain-containing protein [Betaproteobacteria bacterium]
MLAPRPDKARTSRAVRLFKNGRSQALRIPKEFELPGNQATIRREGDRLIVEPLKRTNRLAMLFNSWKPLKGTFPEAADPPIKAEEVL